MSELLPCPFCGGVAEFRSDKVEPHFYSFVRCKVCKSGTAFSKCEIEHYSRDDEFNKVSVCWNRRADGWTADGKKGE